MQRKFLDRCYSYDGRVWWRVFPILTTVYGHFGSRHQDTSASRHIGNGAEVSVGHFGASAEVSGHIGTGVEVSVGHFGTGAEVTGHFGTGAEVSLTFRHRSQR